MRRGARDEQADGPVARLQAALKGLGFGIVGPVDGIFGRRTAWAVREFRIAAAGDVVAVETDGDAAYADRLLPVPNHRRLDAPISGVADGELLELVEHWQAQRWRPPVVAEAWSMSGGERVELAAENVWLSEEVPDDRVRVYVVDLSGRWVIPDEHGADNRVVLGYREPGGPNMSHRHAWPELEVTPESLLGAVWEDLTESERSTFRVTRAVSEQECLGYLDLVNAWDNAVLSTGPYHWTLAIDGQEGELAPLLAWYRRTDPKGWETTFGSWGLHPGASWDSADVDDDRHPSTLWRASSRRFVGRVHLADEHGRSQPIDGGLQAHEWLRGWHWLYRFVMQARTQDTWRRAIWDYSRMRLRDLAATPLDPDSRTLLGADGSTVLGDVATSEVSMALLARWHVRMPAHVCRDDRTGPGVREALGRMSPPGLDRWGDREQETLVASLIDAMAAHVGEDFAERMRTETSRWPAWPSGTRGWRLDTERTGGLRTTHGSFVADTGGLP